MFPRRKLVNFSQEFVKFITRGFALFNTTGALRVHFQATPMQGMTWQSYTTHDI